eukprot:Clim_evm11s18 gene=Clim_evmTU11s18
MADPRKSRPKNAGQDGDDSPAEPATPRSDIGFMAIVEDLRAHYAAKEYSQALERISGEKAKVEAQAREGSISVWEKEQLLIELQSERGECLRRMERFDEAFEDLFNAFVPKADRAIDLHALSMPMTVMAVLLRDRLRKHAEAHQLIHKNPLDSREQDINAFECLKCSNLLFDPVTALCGHTFCRTCIDEPWRSRTCEICNSLLPYTFGSSSCVTLKLVIEKAFPSEGQAYNILFDVNNELTRHELAWTTCRKGSGASASATNGRPVMQSAITAILQRIQEATGNGSTQLSGLTSDLVRLAADVNDEDSEQEAEADHRAEDDQEPQEDPTTEGTEDHTATEGTGTGPEINRARTRTDSIRSTTSMSAEEQLIRDRFSRRYVRAHERNFLAADLYSELQILHDILKDAPVHPSTDGTNISQQSKTMESNSSAAVSTRTLESNRNNTITNASFSMPDEERLRIRAKVLKALEELDRAAELFPGSQYTDVTRSLVNTKIGNTEKGTSFAQDAIKKQPRNGKGQLALAQALVKHSYSDPTMSTGEQIATAKSALTQAMNGHLLGGAMRRTLNTVMICLQRLAQLYHRTGDATCKISLSALMDIYGKPTDDGTSSGAIGHPPPSPSKRRRLYDSASVYHPEDARTDLECQLCLNLLHMPTTTSCGHTYCRGCLSRTLDHSSSCPFCRSELPGYLTERHGVNRVLEQFIKMRFDKEYEERTKQYEEEEETSQNIPLFVCTLAYPGIPCPLHIFEPRYRLMMRRCVETGTRQFGMCLPSPAGSFMDVGVLLYIRNLTMLPDGRSLVDCVGVRRFKVIERGMKDGYHVGEVEWIQDDPVDPNEDDVQQYMDHAREIASHIGNMLGDGTDDDAFRERFGEVPGEDPEKMGLWLLALLPLHDHMKYPLVETTDTVKRLRTVTNLFNQVRLADDHSSSLSCNIM